MGRVLACGLLVLLASASFYLAAPDEGPRQRGERPKQSDRFSNILLHTQHGEAVRFYDDLVRDRTVLINLMFAGCGDVCPANSAVLARLHERLGGRVGKDIAMLSLSIDPAGDTPERLHRYWQAFGARAGWRFLTGKPEDIDRLRRELGLSDPDPAVDADLTQHSGVLTVGNDRTNRWSALPLLMDEKQLASTILRIANDGAPARGVALRGSGDYAVYCAACHGALGEGNGPLAHLLEPAPARHSDAQRMAALSDAYLFRLLKEGGPAVGRSPLMSPWGRTLSDERIVDLIAYLRALPASPP
jgi:protein SCO1/2